MLVIVMHNNQDYLQHLAKLATKQGIKDFRIEKKKGMGTPLMN